MSPIKKILTFFGLGITFLLGYQAIQESVSKRIENVGIERIKQIENTQLHQNNEETFSDLVSLIKSHPNTSITRAKEGLNGTIEYKFVSLGDYTGKERAEKKSPKDFYIESTELKLVDVPPEGISVGDHIRFSYFSGTYWQEKNNGGEKANEGAGGLIIISDKGLPKLAVRVDNNGEGTKYSVLNDDKSVKNILEKMVPYMKILEK